MTPRLNRCRLSNTISTLTDRTITFATFALGGMMHACPDLRICLAHGVCYTCYGARRMDRGWKVRLEARTNIQQPPSTYLNRFCYGCLTHSEPVLRYLIDTVGIDRLVIDTDCPANMIIE